MKKVCSVLVLLTGAYACVLSSIFHALLMNLPSILHELSAEDLTLERKEQLITGLKQALSYELSFVNQFTYIGIGLLVIGVFLLLPVKKSS